jgi:cytochrome c-type biogenesis protein CcmH/NrfG
MNIRSVTLLCLVVASSIAACKRTEQAPPPPSPTLPSPAADSPAGAMPPSPAAGGDYQQRILAAEQIVQQEPKNVRAWIQLGNDYFDTHQRQRAIDAYAKALELQPNNPDVLTDQGVMYRELGSYDRAIANFTKANELDPKHVQSVFNLGVVYEHDLKDSGKAVQAWRRVIDIAPGSPQATQALQGIAEIQQRSAPRQ